MKVIIDDLWFCTDCLFAAVNGDFDALSPKRAAAVEKALGELGPHVVPDFDAEKGEGIEEFSTRSCDCCDSGLAGGRHRFAILGE